MKKISVSVFLAFLLIIPLLNITAQGGPGRGQRNNSGNGTGYYAQYAANITAEGEQEMLKIFSAEEKENLADLKSSNPREYYRTLRRANMQAQGLCTYPDGCGAGTGRGYNKGVCPYVN